MSLPRRRPGPESRRGAGGPAPWRRPGRWGAAVLALLLAVSSPAWAGPLSDAGGGPPGGGAGGGLKAGRPVAPSPSSAPVRRHVVLVLADGLDWAALDDPALDGLRFWLDRGAVGAMNAATAGRGGPGEAYLTLGAGSRAAAPDLAGLGFEVGEEAGGWSAGSIYQGRTGAPPQGEVVHLGVWGLKEANASLRHLVRVGALGGSLARAGVVRAVLGNSDVSGSRQRPAVALAMDESGQVDLGLVGEGAVVGDPLWPGGARTDWPALAREVDRLWARAGFFAVDAGDLARVDEGARLLEPSRGRRLRAQALTGLDWFLRFLSRRLDPSRDLLILLSPRPATTDSERGEGLAPVLAAGSGFGHGVLTSATTRRRALVANIDVLPTVVRFLGAEVPGEVYGAPFAWVASQRPLEEASRLASRALANHRQRPPLIRGYVGLAMGCLALAALAATWLPRWRPWAQPLLLALLASPLAFLVLPLARPPGVAGAAAAAVALSGGLAAACRALGPRRPLLPLFALGLAALAAVTLDQALGAPLALHSPLGYSPIGGARFYGLGNEFLGVACGSGITAFFAALDLWPARRRCVRALGGVALGSVALALGWPRLGANVGGALTASAAFGLVVWQAAGGRLGARTLLAALGCGAGLLALLAAADLALAGLRPAGPPTGAGGAAAGPGHLGRAILLLAQFGPATLADLVARKLDLNLRLIRYTVWSRVLLVSVASLGLLLYRPVGRFSTLSTRYPSLALGLRGMLVAAAVALLANDSGVVAAATAMVYPPAVLGYLALAEPPGPGRRAA
ncbi:MAG: hypothetical protein K6T75_08805 [Acetobacteraceae bacterium]|nr:hypothetical protein [Acetobacteraceae bacterium]